MKGAIVMGANGSIFERIEKKYVLDESTYNALREKLAVHFKPDRYPKGTIYNIYFDTPNDQLVRTSIEKPLYKEKLRLRSYAVPDKKSKVFVELKKKFQGVVYKRRVDMTLEQAEEFLSGGNAPGNDPQIEKELDYFLSFYQGIGPAMYLSYDRLAFVAKDDPELRLTFDTHILYRQDNLGLDKGQWGKELLPPGTRIMEIKIPGSMPLWLSHILDELKIYPASFSKYGTAYSKELAADLKKGKVITCA